MRLFLELMNVCITAMTVTPNGLREKGGARIEVLSKRMGDDLHGRLDLTFGYSYGKMAVYHLGRRIPWRDRYPSPGKLSMS
jgi:hypothetical protein